MITVFGIPNCSTIKKARDWLDSHAIAYQFYDYKKQGADAAALESWVREVGWQALLNMRGTTWRTLSDAERADLDEKRAISLMLAKPSLIRRPVIAGAGPLMIGFDSEAYQGRFAIGGGSK